MSSPDRIELDTVARQRLEHLIRAGTTPQQLVVRARIVMLAAAQWPNPRIAARVGVCVGTVRTRRHRWSAEPGTASVKALACAPPEASGLPLSRWSCPDLADQVVAEGITASVSTSTV